MSIYILSTKKVDGAINLPVFKINFIKQNINFHNYDALIFTSKNSILAINSFNKLWQTIPSYVIAPQTANILKQHNGTLEFVGKTNNGNDFAQELIKKLQNKKVLYLRGDKVVSNLVDILNTNHINCNENIVYKTTCKTTIKPNIPPKNSVIIFSSPSTIDCFLKNFKWLDSYYAISIGKTTAKYFPSYIKPIISDTTSLESCVSKAKLLFYL
jgi:uroporphyrinogen-III synthase